MHLDLPAKQDTEQDLKIQNFFPERMCVYLCTAQLLLSVALRCETSALLVMICMTFEDFLSIYTYGIRTYGTSYLSEVIRAFGRQMLLRHKIDTAYPAGRWALSGTATMFVRGHYWVEGGTIFSDFKDDSGRIRPVKSNFGF